MPRPQQFDRDTVLDQAMLVFWLKGFDGASIQDLVDATGLNRGSLYNTFGDKAQLFAEVMERYRASSPVRSLAEAAPDADVRCLFHDFFSALVKRAKTDREGKGCLLTKTSAGLYGCTDAMAAWVRNTLAGMEDTFTALVKRGQKQGTITNPSKPRAIARYLVSAAQGLNVMASAGAKPEALEDIAEQSVRVLD